MTSRTPRKSIPRAITSVLTITQLSPFRIRLIASSRSLFVNPACRQSTFAIPFRTSSSASDDARGCVEVKISTGGWYGCDRYVSNVGSFDGSSATYVSVCDISGSGVSLPPPTSVASSSVAQPGSLKADDDPYGVPQHVHRYFLYTSRECCAENGLLHALVRARGCDLLYLSEKLAVQQSVCLIQNQMTDTGKHRNVGQSSPCVRLDSTYLSSSREPFCSDATSRKGVAMMTSAVINNPARYP